MSSNKVTAKVRTDQQLINEAFSNLISFYEDNSHRYKMAYGDKDPDYIEQSGYATRLVELRTKILEQFKESSN